MARIRLTRGDSSAGRVRVAAPKAGAPLPAVRRAGYSVIATGGSGGNTIGATHHDCRRRLAIQDLNFRLSPTLRPEASRPDPRVCVRRQVDVNRTSQE